MGKTYNAQRDYGDETDYEVEEYEPKSSYDRRQDRKHRDLSRKQARQFKEREHNKVFEKESVQDEY